MSASTDYELFSCNHHQHWAAFIYIAALRGSLFVACFLFIAVVKSLTRQNFDSKSGLLPTPDGC